MSNEQEILSHEWIDKNKVERIDNLRKMTTSDVVPVEKLKSLLMTNENNYIKHLISESMAIKSENQKLKAKVEDQEITIEALKQTLFELRLNINKLKGKYSK